MVPGRSQEGVRWCQEGSYGVTNVSDGISKVSDGMRNVLDGESESLWLFWLLIVCCCF